MRTIDYLDLCKLHWEPWHPLTHLVHVQQAADGLQNGAVSLHHVELEQWSCCSIAHDVRDAAKDQLIPPTQNCLACEIPFCRSKVLATWLVSPLKNRALPCQQQKSGLWDFTVADDASAQSLLLLSSGRNGGSPNDVLR